MHPGQPVKVARDCSAWHCGEGDCRNGDREARLHDEWDIISHLHMSLADTACITPRPQDVSFDV